MAENSACLTTPQEDPMLEGFVPWPEERARAYRAKGYWESLSIFEMVARSAARHPDKIALVAGTRRISYGDPFRLPAHGAGDERRVPCPGSRVGRRRARCRTERARQLEREKARPSAP